MTILQIFFENEQTIYVPGQHVIGIARVILDKRAKTKGIKLNFHGKGMLVKHEGKRHYVTREPYMDVDVVLASNHGGPQEEFYLEPGEYTYPFTFQLPNQLPSSFKHANPVCSIKYHVKLVFIKPWAFDDKIERELIIREHFDVSVYPELATPFEYTGVINAYTFFCCNKRTLLANFQMEKRGFGQGDVIKVKGVVKNDSTQPVEKLYLVLVEVLHFTCQNRTWYKTNHLAGLPLNPMPPQHTERYEDLQLRVPLLTNPILNNSLMVDIKYALLISSKEAPRFDDADNMNIPIAVGSNLAGAPQIMNPAIQIQ